ncbi:flagellar filament capping protein FliD [Vibrio sp. 10N]|uniref:flagellar filament capping protein FliD n=1 Tax=Vibrio sp. 10N TaxID=3058938 RepID=UPI0028139D9A|nr:flagellar filament capping protein FliD [Vibrio sp. 10N]
MNVDAVQLASNFASLDVQPFELRYSQKLSTISSQTSAINQIKSALQKLDDQVYEFTKAGATLMQSAITTNEDYLSVTADSGVSGLDLDIFVHQLAQNHQMMVDVSSTDPSDVMASDGSFTVTNTQSGDAQSINIMDADSDASGDVTYTEFVTYFNSQFEDSMQAVIVKSQGAMKVLFSAVSDGEENNFSLSSDATSDWGATDVAAASVVQSGQDAQISIGGETGALFTNNSNTFEDLVSGVDVTLKKANASGDTATSVQISDDVSATLDSLQSFVDAYNSAVSEITKLTQSGGESDARGVLASDSTVRNIKNQLASVIREDYSGVRLYEVGLELDRNGKLSLDRDKFEEAAKTQDMETLFTGDAGVFQAFDTTLETYLDFSNGSLSRRIDTLNSEKSRINDALSALDARYETYYNRYLSQFTQLNALSSQLQSVSGLFTV